MDGRQGEFKTAIRRFMREQGPGEPVPIALLYDVVADRCPMHIDDERRPPPNERTLHWHHDVQWALEKLVQGGEIERRKDLGRGIYAWPAQPPS